MKSRNRSNALLVELLIVVLFFMISATVLMQVFSAARTQGERSGWITKAAADAQNIAECLSAAGDLQEVLSGLGFSRDENDEALWRLTQDGFEEEVHCSEEPYESGILYRQQVSIYRDSELLIRLPAARYEEVRP